ncbi:MAG: hypothetical protein HC814_05625, partial [Rhodobacteraceae bacterium]|nr:hypothetical protein [Paracoccaceae bacterium]
MSGTATQDDETVRNNWRIRVAVVILLLIAVTVVSVTNKLLTERFTEST